MKASATVDCWDVKKAFSILEKLDHMYIKVFKRDVVLQICHFADNIHNHREKSTKQLKP